MTTIPPLKRNAWTILRENALQIVMYLLGTALVGLVWPPLGLVYFIYGIFSNYMYMAWVCPYCGHYLLASCAAGFDILSGRRFRAQPGRTFGSEFRRRSRVLYPGWFVPPAAGLYLLITAFAWPVLALLAVFCLDAFWLLPKTAQKHCEACETVDCPRYPKHKQAALTGRP